MFAVSVFLAFAAATVAAAQTVTLLQYTRPYTATEGSKDVPFPTSAATESPFASSIFFNDQDFNQGMRHYAQGPQMIPIAGAAFRILPLGAALADCPAAAFDPTEYDVSALMLATGIEVYFGFGADIVRVAVVCPTAGACAFGPSPYFTMGGTDPVVGWVDDIVGAPTLLDVYAFQTGIKPSVDKSQDVALVSAYQGDPSECAMETTAAPTAVPVPAPSDAGEPAKLRRM